MDQSECACDVFRDRLEIKIVNACDEKDFVPKRPQISNNSRNKLSVPNVQGKPNKKVKRKRRWLFISSFTIANAIINFTHVTKKFEINKMEMMKFITSQMLQNEDNRIQIVQG